MKIRFLREAGGHGDVVRCLGTVASVRAALPDAKLWFYTVGVYDQWARMSPDVDRVVRVEWHERAPNEKPRKGEARTRDETPDPRKHPYLARHGRFDATVDMYDPAFAHERQTSGMVYADRIDCWTGHAAVVLGVDLQPHLARLAVGAHDYGWIDGWLHAVASSPSRRPLVVLQPLSVDPRRSLTPVQTMRSVELLSAVGVSIVVAHVRTSSANTRIGTPRHRLEDATLRWLVRSRVPIFAAPTMSTLAALVSRADCLLTGDSALLHVAAALGKLCVSLFGITRGDIICKHYPLAVPICAGQRERAGCRCAEDGRACYGFPRRVGDDWRRPCGGAGCVAQTRVPSERLVEEVLGCLNHSRR